jgi:hypothetical protein
MVNRYILAPLVVVAALAAISLPIMGFEGSSIIGEIMRQRAERQIISWIGQTEYMRQQLVDAIDKAVEEVVRLREVAVDARVAYQQQAGEVEELQKKHEQERKQLAIIAPAMAAGDSLRLANGVELNGPALALYADQTVKSFVAQQATIAAYQEAVERNRQTAEEATAQFYVAQQQVANLKAKLELFDAKVLQVKLEENRSGAAAGSLLASGALAEADLLFQEILQGVDTEILQHQERAKLQVHSVEAVAAPDYEQLTNTIFDLLAAEE